jgi:trypsin
MGFGLTSEDGVESNYLQEVNVNVVPHETCNNQYDGEVFEDVMFCAGEEGKDSCQGDSGGPIFDPNTGVLVGLVSWVSRRMKWNVAPIVSSLRFTT